ncbi:MAG: HlyD family type I secretion periplasmic adaptor subunit [Desulfovibrionaceae bacterium]|nr:HlyD family type I secretion periplasmic adaptor subunit [Desulfovibrionaceae bacterium]
MTQNPLPPPVPPAASQDQPEGPDQQVQPAIFQIPAAYLPQAARLIAPEPPEEPGQDPQDLQDLQDPPAAQPAQPAKPSGPAHPQAGAVQQLQPAQLAQLAQQVKQAQQAQLARQAQQSKPAHSAHPAHQAKPAGAGKADQPDPPSISLTTQAALAGLGQAAGPAQPGKPAQPQAGAAAPPKGLFARIMMFLKGEQDAPPLPDGGRSKLTPEELPYSRAHTAAYSRMPAIQSRKLSICIISFFIIMIIWAGLAEVDEVTHADGQIIAAQRLQAIQNLEGGILSDLFVREGQIVSQGDILARLDNESAASMYRDAVSRALENQASILRLRAELADEEPVFPESASAWLGELMDANISADIESWAKNVFEDQAATWRARRGQREAELMLLRAQHDQRRHELEEQRVRLRQLEANLELAQEKMRVITPLAESGSYSKVDYLNLQSQVVSLQGEFDSLMAAEPRIRAAVEETERRIAFREAELASNVTDEINRRRLELASLRETLSAGGDRVSRTELLSPVRGSVRQIYINTVGGVVKPGESIMDIVPLEGALLVEVKVRPADVAFLEIGQTAMVKISAYDFSIYGGLPGKLEQISADTIEDRRGDVFYQARVRTESNAIVYQGKELDIMPGMLATADILHGKKTILDYILKPVLKTRQRALRER